MRKRAATHALLLAAALFVATPAAAAGEGRVAPPLQAMAAANLGSDQGVYVEAADGTVLAAQHPARAVHPASVIKTATSLALLLRFGPEHRFETRLVAAGPIGDDGAIDGDLVVEGGGDPFFVYESALLALAELHETGVRKVHGNVRARGTLIYNWTKLAAAERVRATLSGADAGRPWLDVQTWRFNLAGRKPTDIALAFAPPRPNSGSGSERALVSYRSPPLSVMLKSLNGYSNNVFHLFADHVGGAAGVQSVARAQLPEAMRSEIVVTNAAGLGTTNRLSPRAAVALLRALRAESVRRGVELTSLLPVSGKDKGTLRGRLVSGAGDGLIVGKTGSYGSLRVSSLAGVMKTELYGEVFFSIHNTELEVWDARRRQDAFVRALAAHAGAVPYRYEAPFDEPLRLSHVRALQPPCCAALR